MRRSEGGFFSHQFRLSNYGYYLRRRYELIEDEVLLELEDIKNKNQNFIKDKDVNFRLYPFYINWKKLENNEYGYYRIFVHFGYFGAAIYSIFKKKDIALNVKNILFYLSSFIPDYLLKDDKKDALIQENIKFFFENVPEVDTIFEIIENKIIMFREISILLIILKIYEINFIINNNKNQIEKVLKCEYLIGTYLTNSEFIDIYRRHFKGKVFDVFKKLVENKGKQYEMAKTRDKFFNHIKYIYNKFIKDSPTQY